jgi:hypothetical protein
MVYHGVLFSKIRISKDDRTFDNSGVTTTYSVSFEYDSKTIRFILYCYEKLLEHDDFISVNNSLITVVIIVLPNDQIISSAIFL